MFWSILTDKTGFWSILAERYACGRFWVILGHWGFPDEFFESETGFLGIFNWFHRDSNPGPPARELDFRSSCIPGNVRKRNFSKSKPKIPLNHRFRPVGVRPKKKLLPRKLWEIIPDSVVTFFFGPLPLCGPERALWGWLLVVAC